jgi:PIN domain nuclease of toxin-antitoxin system
LPSGVGQHGLSDEPIVLDTSALLALLQNEPGAGAVAEALPHAIMSAVNLSEVVAKLTERGVPAKDLREALDGLAIDIRAFDEHDAYLAGALRTETRDLGLSFGNRACLALAMKLGMPALTADRAWASLALDRLVVSVIR